MVVESTYEELEQEIRRLRAENEYLRENENKDSALFKTMALGVVYQDGEGQIISANPAAEKILGLSLDQMQGRTSMDPRWQAVHEDGSEFLGETHPSMVALRTGKELKNVIMGVFNPNSEKYRWINIHAIPQFKPGEKVPFQVYTTFNDITDRKLAEEALKKAYKQLETEAISHKEANIALEVLLRKRDEDRVELEEKILSNLKDLVEPYLEKLRMSGLDDRQHAYINIVESNLTDIVSPFTHRLSSKYFSFTPSEIQIANLIKQGKTTKEIADLLHLASRTICFHRQNIRKKLGINNKKTNLRTHLSTLRK